MEKAKTNRKSRQLVAKMQQLVTAEPPLRTECIRNLKQCLIQLTFNDV